MFITTINWWIKANLTEPRKKLTYSLAYHLVASARSTRKHKTRQRCFHVCMCVCVCVCVLSVCVWVWHRVNKGTRYSPHLVAGIGVDEKVAPFRLGCFNISWQDYCAFRCPFVACFISIKRIKKCCGRGFLQKGLGEGETITMCIVWHILYCFWLLLGFLALYVFAATFCSLAVTIFIVSTAIKIRIFRECETFLRAPRIEHVERIDKRIMTMLYSWTTLIADDNIIPFFSAKCNWRPADNNHLLFYLHSTSMMD